MRSASVGNAGDLDLVRVQVLERLRGEVGLGQPLQRVARARPGEVHGGERTGHVHDLRVVAPHCVPPLEPRGHRVGARRRRRHVEEVVGEPRDRAVVHDPAAVRGEDAVADAPGLHVAEAVRVQALEERDGLRPLDEELAERRDVDDAERLVHRAHLVLGMLAVRVRTLPRAGPLDRRAGLLVAPVDRAAAGRRELASGEQAELDRRPRRPRGRRPDRRLVHPVLLCVDADAREVAELALARAHRRRRVALRELDRVEALADRALHVLRRHVLADAHEALALPVVRTARGRSSRDPRR